MQAKTYSLLSSSISNFFCVPFGGYAMLSYSQTHASVYLKVLCIYR